MSDYHNPKKLIKILHIANIHHCQDFYTLFIIESKFNIKIYFHTSVIIKHLIFTPTFININPNLRLISPFIYLWSINFADFPGRNTT